MVIHKDVVNAVEIIVKGSHMAQYHKTYRNRICTSIDKISLERNQSTRANEKVECKIFKCQTCDDKNLKPRITLVNILSVFLCKENFKEKHLSKPE